MISSEAGLALKPQQQELEVQEVEFPPQQELEYTPSLSHRSLPRGTSSEQAGILHPGSGASRRDSSRHSSRNPSPLSARVLPASPTDLPPTYPTTKPSSRPSSAGSRRGDLSPSEERAGSMRFSGSPSQRSSVHSPNGATQEQFSASAPLPRSSVKSRQASISSNRGSITGGSHKSLTLANTREQDQQQQQQVPANSQASPARPLSSKVEAINSKDYFKQHTLQMKSPAEIAEMKRDLDFCLKELQHASKRMEELEFQNTYLEAEVRFITIGRVLFAFITMITWCNCINVGSYFIVISLQGTVYRLCSS